MTARSPESFIEEGLDTLSILTPLIENRRKIVFGTILVALSVGAWAAIQPRRYKAELSLSPVTSTRSPQALGGLAALAGATLQTGYQLTPARMVEFLKSQSVLAGVGMSPSAPTSRDRVVDKIVGKQYEPRDAESISKQVSKLLDITSNKETGTIRLSVSHRDSVLARLIAVRIVDSASHVFVRTSKAQAQQLRIAQEARVDNAASQLREAEENLRRLNFSNRATPAYSVAGLERDRLAREIRFAEQVYTQAVSDRDAAYARELEATPTVVVQDPVPTVLPKVRKRIVVKTVIAAMATFVVLCLLTLLNDLLQRRLAQPDVESERFRSAVSSLPRLKQGTRRAV